jgi:hypothetical protein
VAKTSIRTSPKSGPSSFGGRASAENPPKIRVTVHKNDGKVVNVVQPSGSQSSQVKLMLGASAKKLAATFRREFDDSESRISTLVAESPILKVSIAATEGLQK